eukprot:TRINITY_DN40003_c0_g1_i1.p1 TRINITY_DN40003_c0_g1~~TRINITY_DN40003_c0_g1_i1.p1  ORF type:complete len:528 (+),score=53.58 TRINITY_DN40003_c0_g1_i1:93-1676(+)
MSTLSSDQLIIIGCATVLVVHFGLVAKSLFDYLRSTWSLRTKIWERLRSWCTLTAEKDRMKEYVDREIDKHVVQSMRRVILVARHAFCIMLALILFNLLNGKALQLSDIQVLMIIVASVLVIFGSTVDYLVNRITVHLWYAFMLLGVTFFLVLSGPMGGALTLFASHFVPLRLILSVNYLKIPSIFIINVICALVSVYANDNNVYCEADVSCLHMAIGREVLVVFAILYLSSMTETSLRSEILRTMQVTCSQGEGTAMMRLLDLVCEVVVELDSQECVSDHSEGFAAVFNISPGLNTKGYRLQTFMPHAADHERFEAMLRSTSAGVDAVPSVMQATLHDSCGTIFKAEVFCVHFRGIGESSRYYIGIQETRDEPMTDLRQFRSAKRSRRPQVSSDNVQTGLNLHEIESNLSASESGESSSVGAPSSETLLHQNWQRTTTNGKRLGLLSAMLSWNINVPQKKCCAYHAACDEVNRILSTMKRGQCIPSFKTDFSAQCSNCGNLDFWARVSTSLECKVCDQRTMSQGTR